MRFCQIVTIGHRQSLPSCENSDLIGPTVSPLFVANPLLEAGPRASFLGNKADRREPSQGTRLWGLPRTLAHIRNSRCPATEILCQAFGLFCGIPRAGMAPCGPLYSLHGVYRRKGLGSSRLFGINVPVSYQPNSACNTRSELLHLSVCRSSIRSPSA